jgi:cell division protein FtsX
MFVLKGVILGLGISLAGAVLYMAYWMHRSLQEARQYYPQRQGEIGFDVGSMVKAMMHSPIFWALATISVIAGCAITYLSHRPTTI